MKKILSLSTLALAGVLAFTGCSCKDKGAAELPAPRKEQTANGAKCTMDSEIYYAPDCSSVLLKENLWNYLGREDSVYIDLRSDSEIVTSSEGGMGYIKGFKVIDYNAAIYGDSVQLFKKSNGADDLMPRYEYSLDILESIFPRDKNLFIMCAGGVRVTTMLKILDTYGYDMSRVYNIGGSNHIKGKDYEEVRKNYTFEKMVGESALKTGVDTDDSYTTYVNLRTDKDGKITTIYVTGKVVSNTSAEWDASKWLKEADAYAQKLVGKSLADINTMLGANGATGADVVTGATASSNRVLRAVKVALTPAQ